METAIREVGFCAICEGDYKLANGKLVHHGYKRPGYGYIVGDCLAVHREPYETSCDVVREYRAMLELRLIAMRRALSELKTATYFETLRTEWRSKDLIVESWSMFVTKEWRFKEKKESAIHNAEREIEGFEREAARCTKWIDGWMKKPVRTVEEELKKTAEKKAEREARLAAARAEKARIEAAKKAKRDALEVRREAEKAGIIAEVKKLAAEGTWARNAKPIEALAARMRRCPKLWHWIYSAGIDAELIKLGLAYRSGTHLQLYPMCFK